MKKKGFTLIELLAVIIILAVIALTATPIVLNVVGDVKDSAAKSSAYGIMDAARYYYSESLLDLSKSGIDGVTNLLPILLINGDKPDDGVLYINEKGQIKMSVVYGNKCFTKDFNDAQLTLNNDVDNCVIVTNTYVFEGVLYDSTNILANYSLVVFSDIPHYAITDSNGKFKVENLEFGTHEIYLMGNKTIEELKLLSKEEIIKEKIASSTFETSDNFDIIFSNSYRMAIVDIEKDETADKTTGTNKEESSDKTTGTNKEESSDKNTQSSNIVVPQTGKWQYKKTPTVGYIIFGVDDDNLGNANFVRTMREFGMKYVLNSETINLDRVLNADNSSTWHYGNNAPSAAYPNGVTVLQLSKDTIANGWGEVALHGPSTYPLIESDLLTGSSLDTAYNTYVSGGGTKSKNDFLQAFKDKYAFVDVSQGASYISEIRKTYENALGSPIYTVGKWGGNPEYSVDNITIGTKNDLGISASGESEASLLRKLNFMASGNLMNISFQTLVHGISRSSYGLNESKSAIDYAEENYTLIELYWHTFENPNDIGIDNFRELLEYARSKVDSGKIKVVTRKEFAELGEYVSNPITSISITRKSNITIGSIDSDADYNIEVTYLDGSKGKPESDVIIKRGSVKTDTLGNYTVTAYYRGFKADCSVAVISSYNTPENLKSTGYWFIYRNNTDGNWYAGNSSSGINSAINSAGKLVFPAVYGKINGWKSTDNGATWELVTDNVTNYKNIKTDGSDNGYNFNSKAYDSINFIETSGNFPINY